MMRSPDFLTLREQKEIKVTKVTLGDLGFTGHPTTAQILEQVPKLGLALLPAETGPHARLQDKTQSRGDSYYIGMNPLTDIVGRLLVFEVARDNTDLLCLWGGWAGSMWHIDSTFVFGISK